MRAHPRFLSRSRRRRVGRVTACPSSLTQQSQRPAVAEAEAEAEAEAAAAATARRKRGPAWGGWVAVLTTALSRHPPLRSQGARHSQPAGDGGEPLLGAVPAQMAIAVSLEARLSRPANSRTPSPIDEGRGSSGQGTAPCSSAQHTTNESSARHKAVGGGSHLMPSNANLQSNRAAIMWSFQVFAFVRSVRCFESDIPDRRVQFVVQQQGDPRGSTLVRYRCAQEWRRAADAHVALTRRAAVPAVLLTPGHTR